MARVSFDFKKGDLVWVSLVVVLLSVGFGVAAWVDKPQYHDDAEIKVYFNGSDRSLSEAMAMIDAAGDFGGGSGGLMFGDWEDVTSSYSLGTSVSVNTDGFVVLYADPNVDDIIGYTGACGSENDVIRSLHRNVGTWGGFTMPVKAGDCWKVTADGTAGDIDVLHWLPIVSGGSSGIDIVTAVVNNANTPSATLTLTEGEWLVEVNVAVTSGGSVTARNILIDGVDAGDVKGAANRDGDTSGFGTAFRTVSVVGARDVTVAVDGTLATTLRNSVFSAKAIRVGS